MKNLLRALASSSLAVVLAVGVSADTIYMKNGSVIRGSVVGYGNGEFTVLMTSGPGGSRSRAMLAGDEIDHIEFSNGGEAATGDQGSPSRTGTGPVAGSSESPAYDPSYDAGDESAGGSPPPGTYTGSSPASDPGASGAGRETGEGDVTVDPKSDWTNTGFRVSRGTRVRITATGSVKLDPTGRRTSTPAGVQTPDRDKLMPNRPTGSLIAVVGDDNDDFLYVGTQAQFVADRPGYLFLSVNEGYLKDNSGGFVAHVVVEPPATAGSVARSGGGGLNGGRPPVVPARRTTIPSSSSPPPSYPDSSSSGERGGASTSSIPPSDPSPTGGMNNATVAWEGDVVVQANLDWTNTKIHVQRGNLIRISASGSVVLRPGLRSDPSGVSSPDNDKLIANRPTGALIAVVGDDNDDFIFVGPQSEFLAQHDGILFLSVNEGNLKDNTGTFNAHVTVLQPQVVSSNTQPSAGHVSSSPAPRRQPAGPTQRSSPGLPRPVVDDTLGGASGAVPARPIPVAIGADGGQADIVVPAKSDWTSTSIVLKKGMKVRITASGTAKLDSLGRTAATPAGVASADPHKVIKDKPTGGLIAVIGDDSSDYIFVGTAAEFTVQRDGLLFLGINEGELFDNSGAYTVHIVIEPPRKR